MKLIISYNKWKCNSKMSCYATQTHLQQERFSRKSREWNNNELSILVAYLDTIQEAQISHFPLASNAWSK
jgi:hypothetical protein